MSLGFLLDEHLRGPLHQAIQDHNDRGVFPIDVICVGDAPDLPLGSDDPEILAWAEREQRIIVTRDEATMISHLADHLQVGHHSPGVFLLHDNSSLPQVIGFLSLAAHAGDEYQWRDHVEYIP